MGRRAPGDAEALWLKDVWLWARDLAVEQDGAIQVVLTPTPRRGVWRVVARILDAVDGKPARIRVQVGCEYPTGEARSLAAQLYALFVQLEDAASRDTFNQAHRGD